MSSLNIRTSTANMTIPSVSYVKNPIDYNKSIYENYNKRIKIYEY